MREECSMFNIYTCIPVALGLTFLCVKCAIKNQVKYFCLDSTNVCDISVYRIYITSSVFL